MFYLLALNTVVAILVGLLVANVLRPGTHAHLAASGERHIAGNRWSRFQTDVDLPANCNADGIRAKFENDRLTITLPKSRFIAGAS